MTLYSVMESVKSEISVILTFYTFSTNYRGGNRQLRLASWQQIFADRAASGLSVKDYCEANNLKRDQYFYWQSIARKNALAAMPENTSGFALLEPPKHESATPGDTLPGVTIELGNIRLSLADGIRKEQLAAVLEAITHVE